MTIQSCLFVADLHGKADRWSKLFDAIAREAPPAVFLGGDLLPNGLGWGRIADPSHAEYVRDVLLTGLAPVRRALGDRWPAIFVIPGNDDGRIEEAAFLDAEREGWWTWVQGRRVEWGGHVVYGYAFVPPTPFRLKDWEKYDVSRFVDPGCVSPEEGVRSVEVPEAEVRYGTIREDLDLLAGNDDLSRAVFLFHSPPYETVLDRAALDGRIVDHAPLDVHVGSVAIRRFIETRQPLLTLHGHVHESTRLTGGWRQRIGRTHCLGAAHDGPELALVRFDPGDLESAERLLL